MKNIEIILALFTGIFIGLTIAIILAANEYDNKLFKFHIKCVEMREMPIGACSRLFGSRADGEANLDRAMRESGER